MFEVDALLERAADAAGTDDYGSPSFREGLTQLVESLNHEARLSELGSVMAESFLISTLTNRLRVEAWRASHPEVADERVEAPIVVVGMSRSGTTLLSHLIGKDDGLRSLLRWEALESVPPPESTTYATDPRYLTAVEMDTVSDMVLPGFKAIHHDPPDAPVDATPCSRMRSTAPSLPPSISFPAIFVGSCPPILLRRMPSTSACCSCCSPKRPGAGISRATRWLRSR